MPNETVKVDLLQVKAQPEPKPKPLRLHQIAMQVNDLINELERITKINKSLRQRIQDMTKSAK